MRAFGPETTTKKFFLGVGFVTVEHQREPVPKSVFTPHGRGRLITHGAPLGWLTRTWSCSERSCGGKRRRHRMLLECG